MSSVQIFKAEVVFPKPMYWERDRQGNELQYGPYYSMCIALPEGAPSTDYIELYNRHQAYLSFSEGSDEQDYLLGLTSGDELSVVWEQRGQKGRYKAVIPNEVIKLTEGRVSSGPQPEKEEPVPKIIPRQGEDNGLLGETKIEAMRMAVDEIIPVLAYAYESIQGWSIFMEAGPEVMQKFAVTAFLYAKDRYRQINPELVTKNKMEIPEIIFGANPAELPGSLLEAIAEASEFVSDKSQAAAYLKIFGLSKDDIDIDDKDTWWRMFAIAHTYGKVRDKSGSKGAAVYTANMFNLEIPAE